MRCLRTILRCLGTWAIASQLGSESAAAADENSLPPSYVQEAPLPEGFPPPSETGVVVEKTYPQLRSFSATGRGSFMKCFVYLSANQLAMTAPVVIEYQSGKKGAGPGVDGMPIPVERMHFLLERPALDEPHEVGPILVADMPKMRVLSIATQGPMTAEAIDAAQKKIVTRLAEMKGVSRAGEFRLLGYNSPMLAREKNYWEVQLPIDGDAE